jgi:WhiB family redox-sensing transcriptional regulator
MSDVSRLPGASVDKWEWQLLGACRGEASELFFHPENTRGSKRAAREATAKAICARCPVLERCLAYSLTVREPYGVWGGLSESEREALVGMGEDLRDAAGHGHHLRNLGRVITACTITSAVSPSTTPISSRAADRLGPISMVKPSPSSKTRTGWA